MDKQPTAHRRAGIGRIGRVGLILIPCLLLLLAIKANWPRLRTAEGRREVVSEVVTTLRSQDTYIAVLVVIANCWLYGLLTTRLYPTTAHVRRGLGRAAMLVAGTDQDPGDTRDLAVELKHFLLIFILPLLFIAAGIVEYRLVKQMMRSRAQDAQTRDTDAAESGGR